MAVKKCKCGCGRLISDKDNWGRSHDYVHGHRDRKKYPNPIIKGKDHYNWKGGGHFNSKGYRIAYDPNGKTRDLRQIPEHRLIMEKHLGRKLKSSEVVHHIDGNKSNNDIKNLQLETRRSHPPIHNVRDPITGRFTG
jgi:hypothetical protein